MLMYMCLYNVDVYVLVLMSLCLCNVDVYVLV